MHNRLRGCSFTLRRAAEPNIHCMQKVSVHIVTHCPELYEILQHGGCNEQTVHQRVGQEEDEELVVGESYTVVHPAHAQTDKD